MRKISHERHVYKSKDMRAAYLRLYLEIYGNQNTGGKGLNSNGLFTY